MLNRSVGGLRAVLDSSAGLLRPSRVEVDTTEWGAKSCTIPYRMWNRRYPALIPARGDAPLAYPNSTGGERTDLDLSFLGFQSERFTRGGKDGIGTLQALYRGAIFPDGADPVTTLPWVTKSRTQKTVTVQLYTYDNPGYTPAGHAVLTYYSRDITKQYVARDEPDSPLFVPAAAVEDDVTLMRVEAFDPNGVPIEDPVFDTYNRGFVFALDDFSIVPCGRFFEVVEKYSSEIIPVTPPITGAIAGSEVLIAQGGAYFYNNYDIPPTYYGPAFHLSGSYGPPFTYGPNWPNLAVTVKRIVINVSGGAVTGGISENGTRSDITFTTPASAVLSLSGASTLLLNHAVAAGNYLILYVDTINSGSPTIFTYSVFATIP